jgi:hypothetical protein
VSEQFRLLLLNLCVYATWFEVFNQIDVGEQAAGGTAFKRVESDHRISRREWNLSITTIRKIGTTWAPYIRLREASPSDFSKMDLNHGGMVDLREFCEWVRAGEVAANTAIGKVLRTRHVHEKPTRI